MNLYSHLYVLLAAAPRLAEFIADANSRVRAIRGFDGSGSFENLPRRPLVADR